MIRNEQNTRNRMDSENSDQALFGLLYNTKQMPATD